MEPLSLPRSAEEKRFTTLLIGIALALSLGLIALFWFMRPVKERLERERFVAVEVARFDEARAIALAANPEDLFVLLSEIEAIPFRYDQDGLEAGGSGSVDEARLAVERAAVDRARDLLLSEWWRLPPGDLAYLGRILTTPAASRQEVASDQRVRADIYEYVTQSVQTNSAPGAPLYRLEETYRLQTILDPLVPPQDRPAFEEASQALRLRLSAARARQINPLAGSRDRRDFMNRFNETAPPAGWSRVFLGGAEERTLVVREDKGPRIAENVELIQVLRDLGIDALQIPGDSVPVSLVAE